MWVWVGVVWDAAVILGRGVSQTKTWGPRIPAHSLKNSSALFSKYPGNRFVSNAQYQMLFDVGYSILTSVYWTIRPWPREQEKELNLKSTRQQKIDPDLGLIVHGRHKILDLLNWMLNKIYGRFFIAFVLKKKDRRCHLSQLLKRRCS